MSLKTLSKVPTGQLFPKLSYWWGCRFPRTWEDLGLVHLGIVSTHRFRCATFLGVCLGVSYDKTLYIARHSVSVGLCMSW